MYGAVVPLLVSARADIIEVETNGEGIDALSLQSILEAWPPGKPLPKYLYTVPYGCNPSGATATLEQRRRVLTLARKYKFIIIEGVNWICTTPTALLMFTTSKMIHIIGCIMELHLVHHPISRWKPNMPVKKEQGSFFASIASPKYYRVD